MDEEQQQEIQQFSGNFRAITPTSNYEAAFAQLWGGGFVEKDKDENKKEEKSKKDPLDMLEDDPYKKKRRCQGLVWDCWHKACSFGRKREKVQVLDTKASQRADWTQRSFEPAKKAVDQNLPTKEAANCQGQGPRSFERSQDEQRVYETEQHHLGEVRGFVFAAAGGRTYRLAALFLIGKHRFVSLLRPKKARQIFKAKRRKEYSSDHGGNPATETLDRVINIDICVKLHGTKVSTQIAFTHQ